MSYNTKAAKTACKSLVDELGQHLKVLDLSDRDRLLIEHRVNVLYQNLVMCLVMLDEDEK